MSNLEFQSFHNLEQFNPTSSKSHKRLRTAVKALAVLAIIAGAYFLGASTAAQPTHMGGTQEVSFRIQLAEGPVRYNEVWWKRTYSVAKAFTSSDAFILKIFKTKTKNKANRLARVFASRYPTNSQYYEKSMTWKTSDYDQLRYLDRARRGLAVTTVCYKGSKMPRCTNDYKSKFMCFEVPLKDVTKTFGSSKFTVRISLRQDFGSCKINVRNWGSRLQNNEHKVADGIIGGMQRLSR